MDLAQILLLGYLMRTPEIVQGIPLMHLLVAVAVGGILVLLGVKIAFDYASFRRRTQAAYGNYYNRVHNGGRVYPPAIWSRRHGGLAGGCCGEHRGYCRAQRPVRMPRPKVTFVHFHAHSNPHQGYPRDNTYPTGPNKRLALTYEQPRNEMQMLRY